VDDSLSWGWRKSFRGAGTLYRPGRPLICKAVACQLRKSSGGGVAAEQQHTSSETTGRVGGSCKEISKMGWMDDGEDVGGC